MLFGALEIVICLGVVMLVILAIGASLFTRNILIERKEVELLRSDAWAELIECPHCHKALNAEAYVCRFCKKELLERSASGRSDE